MSLNIDIGTPIIREDQIEVLDANGTSPQQLSQDTIGRLRVTDKGDDSVNLLTQIKDIMGDIRDYIDLLSQTGLKSSAASLPVSVANDSTTNIGYQDVVVVKKLIRNYTNIEEGSYVDIELNGHSTLAIGNFDGTCSLNPVVSLDGINWISPSRTMNTIDISSGLMPSNLNFSAAAGTAAIRMMPCAGYKKVRVYASGLTSATTVILRASVAPSAALITGQLGLTANTSLTAATSIQSVSTGTTGTSIARSYEKLQRKLVSASVNNIYGLTVNNLSDSTIYILFYNIATIPTLNSTIYWWLSFPPGLSNIPIGTFGMGVFSVGIAISASLSPYSYILCDIAPDVTIFTAS